MAEQATEVTATPSLEERIADKFVRPEQPEVEAKETTESDVEPEALEAETPESDEAQAEATSDADDGFEDYDLDGASYRIPKELKSRLEAGKDYTRNQQDLANVRRAIDLQSKELALAQERRNFDSSVADDVKQLELIDAYVKHQEGLDWTKATADQRTNALLEIQQYRSRRDELRDTLGKKWNEFQNKLGAERAKLKQEASEALARSIPNWSDDTRGQIEKYVVSLGYAESTIPQMRVEDYIVANKARLYDQLQANKSTVVQKAQQKQAKVIKTSPTRPMPDKLKQEFAFKKALKKATNPSDRTKVLRDRIGEIFG